MCNILTKIVGNSYIDWELKFNSTLWAYRVAYKTAIGTTPFNLVFCLDTILPIEFLVPTLRVAKDLNWTGHELSACVEQLGKLYETRLLAFVGMYAEKCRRKQWFDKNLKEQNFAIGDLVLLYTLKKNKRKLQK